MPIRGQRAIWPKKPRKPSGIFSTKGRQKNDGNGDAPNTGTMNYAYSRKGRSNGTKQKPYKAGSSNLRHQKPAAGKSKSYGEM